MATDLEKKYESKAKVMLVGILFLTFAIVGPHILIQLINSDRLPDIESPMFVEIKSINWDENNHQIKVIVENMINETVTLREVYVNQTLDSEAIMANQVLSGQQTTEIILSQKYAAKPNRIFVRITTSGEFDALKTKVFYEVGLKGIYWDENAGKIRFVVKNLGDDTVTVNEVYVDGAQDVSALPNPIILESKQETTVSLTGVFMDTDRSIPIKVTTIEGVSFETSKSLYGLWIQSINWNSKTGNIVAYVYEDGYLGKWKGEIAYVYVNGTLDSAPSIHDGNGPWTIKSSITYVNKPEQITVKIVTSEGTVGEKTMTPPNEY